MSVDRFKLALWTQVAMAVSAHSVAFFAHILIPDAVIIQTVTLLSLGLYLNNRPTSSSFVENKSHGLSPDQRLSILPNT